MPRRQVVISAFSGIDLADLAGLADRPQDEESLDLPRLTGNRAMILHGFVMSAELAEESLGSERVELVLRVQGVGPGQPRRIVVTHDALLADPTIDADDVVGRGFEAEVDQVGSARWEVRRLSLAGKVLRPKAD